MLALVLAFLVVSGSGGTACDAATFDKLPTLLANITRLAYKPCASSTSGAQANAPPGIPLFATLSFAVLLLSGVVHVCCTMKYFSDLGYPLSDGDDEDFARTMTVWAPSRENSMGSSDGTVSEGTWASGTDTAVEGSLSPIDPGPVMDDDQCSALELGFFSAVSISLLAVRIAPLFGCSCCGISDAVSYFGLTTQVTSC